MAVTCCVIIRKVGEEFPKPEVLWDKKKARARYKELIEEWIDKNKDPKLELELEDLQDDCVYYKSQCNEHILAIHFMEMEAKPSSLWIVYTYHTQTGLRINNLQGIEDEAKAVFFTLCKSLHSTAGYGVGGECDMTEVNHYDGNKGITFLDWKLRRPGDDETHKRIILANLYTESMKSKIAKIVARKNGE